MNTQTRDTGIPSAPNIWWQITRKDLLLLARDRAALFFALGFPLIMAVFFGTAFSGSGENLKFTLAVVNEDASPAANTWLERLAENEALTLKPLPRAEALEGVRKGRWPAALILPRGFGQALEQVFDPDIPTVQLAMDPSRKALAGLLQGLLMEQAAQEVQNFFNDPVQQNQQLEGALAALENEPGEQARTLRKLLLDLQTNLKKVQSLSGNNNEPDDQEFSFQPLNIEPLHLEQQKAGPKNSYAISFPQGMVWAVLGVISTFAMSLVNERSQGTLARLLVLPIHRRHVLGGKALACFLVLMVVLALLLTVGMLAFGIRIEQPAVLALALFSAAFGFTGLMLLLSVLGNSERAASGLSWAVLMLLAMTGGGMIPLIAMPPWMAALGQFSPVKWMVMAFEGALWRQFDLADTLPWAGMLLLMGLAGLALGSWLFNRRQVPAG